MTTMRIIHKYTCKRGLNFMTLCSILVLVGGVRLSPYVGSSPTSKLTPHYYDASCPSLPFLVRASMTAAVQREARMAASIIRLFFHDCFVQGCDASVLLDDVPTTGFKGEKTAFPNNNSLRGFDVVDMIKAKVEVACPALVSCADILALAARDAVVLSGGPFWPVLLGRRDSTTASFSKANENLPSPFADVATLISKFEAQGLSKEDMVTLSGAHTIGKSRCIAFRGRLYNFNNTSKSDPTINPLYLKLLLSVCPSSGGDDIPFFLDVTTPIRFDNQYFTNLIYGKGLLTSDQELFSSDASTSAIVQNYAQNYQDFFANFPKSMIAMGNLNPLTGTSGQVRANCHFVNN